MLYAEDDRHDVENVGNVGGASAGIGLISVDNITALKQAQSKMQKKTCQQQAHQGLQCRVVALQVRLRATSRYLAPASPQGMGALAGFSSNEGEGCPVSPRSSTKDGGAPMR